MKKFSKIAVLFAIAAMLLFPSAASVDMVSLAGDVNLDSKVNFGDVSVLLKSIAGWDVDIAYGNADVTDDGKVNLGDAAKILKYIAKWDTVMPECTDGLAANEGMYVWGLKKYQDSTVLLRNPDKGLYIHYLDNGLSRYGIKDGKYLMPDDLPEGLPIDHIYIRIAWCHLEPEEGKFNWELIDNIIDPWTKAGVDVAFRITCKETDTSQYYATPEWVKDAGAAGKELSNAWEPVWNDPVFLEKLRNFHMAFAERYDSNPNVIYVDIGSLGDWGEGHTTFGSQENYTYDTLLEHMDIYLSAYKNTAIVMNDDILTHEGIGGRYRSELLEYIEENNISLRDDSIATKWHYDQYDDEVYGKTSVKIPNVFVRFSDDVPMILELDHYGNTVTGQNDTWQGGQTLLSAIKQTHATYAGFHYYPVEWYNDGNEEIAAELINNLGYWYFPESFAFSETDGGMKYGFTLKNGGSAQSYKDYGMTLTLVNGEDTVTLHADDFRSTGILPGESGTAYFYGDVLGAGEWTAYIRMSDDTDREILLAMNEEFHSEEYGYKVGTINIKS